MEIRNLAVMILITPT